MVPPCEVIPPDDHDSPGALPSEYEGLFAEFYDILHAGQTVDVGVFLDLAVERGGPALELGCGTGRVLVPLAAAGVEATGIDSSRDMLAILTRKLSDVPEDSRPHLIRADPPARCSRLYCTVERDDFPETTTAM